jgi:hypothetical protein
LAVVRPLQSRIAWSEFEDDKLNLQLLGSDITGMNMNSPVQFDRDVKKMETMLRLFDTENQAVEQ